MPGRLLRLAATLGVTPVVHGAEYLAEQAGPFVFVANHPSELDGPLLQQALAPHVGPVVVVGVERAAGVGGVVERASKVRTVKGLSRLLRHGTSVVLFPERQRSDDGALGEFDAGAAALGIQNRVPLVPVSLSGTYRALPPWRDLPLAGRPTVTVRFGRPIVPTPGSEPQVLNESIVTAVRLGLAEESDGWYGARLAAATTAVPGPASAGSAAVSAEADGDAAHWRRIWKATSPEQSTRRRVWMWKTRM